MENTWESDFSLVTMVPSDDFHAYFSVALIPVVYAASQFNDTGLDYEKKTPQKLEGHRRIRCSMFTTMACDISRVGQI